MHALTRDSVNDALIGIGFVENPIYTYERAPLRIILQHGPAPCAVVRIFKYISDPVEREILLFRSESPDALLTRLHILIYVLDLPFEVKENPSELREKLTEFCKNRVKVKGTESMDWAEGYYEAQADVKEILEG